MPRTTIRSDDITDAQVKTADMAVDAITATQILDSTITTAKMAVDPTNASNLSSGSVPLAQLGNAPATDVSGLQNDIATLALQQSTQNNQSAYNLANAFVDQYEDSTGIDVLTDVERNAGEYMWCAAVGTVPFTSDADTMLLLHMDGANDGTTFTDSSSHGHTVTANGGTHTDTGTKKLGTASAEFIATPANKLTVTYNAMFSTTGNFTWEFWFNSSDTAAKCMWDWRDSGGAGNQDNNMYSDWNSGATDKISLQWWVEQRRFVCTDATDGNWHHLAVVRDESTTANQFYFYYDGVSLSPESGSMVWLPGGQDQINNNSNNLKIGTNFAENAQMVGYYDELRFSNSARYPGGTTFTPNGSIIAGSSGNYTSTTETAAATVSKMGIVVLYKNQSGTATLSTDLVAEVSANGGTNWTAAPLTAGGTFSTGVLIAKSNDITITNTGTAPKFRISFANQSAGVKETRVYGVSLQY